MRVGHVVVGAIVALTVLAAAFFVLTSRADDPEEPTGSSPTSPCPSAVPALEESVWGIDVDKDQHLNSVGGSNAWSSVAGSEHPPTFTYLKVSEGERDPVDVNHFAQRDTGWARAEGITVGFVHWAVPGEPKSISVEEDAIAEARAAVRAMGGSLRSTLPPALGLGLNPRRVSPDAITTWALTWLEEVERLAGRPPMVLASTRFLTKSVEPDQELARYPLWLDGDGCVPAPWSAWTFRTADAAGLPRFGFAMAPGAVVFAAGPEELRALVRS